MTPPFDPTEPRVHAEAIVYRLFDVGYGISLDRVIQLLAPSGPERRLPVRGEAQAIQIANPPVSVSIGPERIEIAGRAVEVQLSARVYDFGVVSMRASVAAEPGITWSAFAAWGAAAGAAPWHDLLVRARDQFLTRIRPAIDQPNVSHVTEDYTVFRVHQLAKPTGEPFAPADLQDGEISRLLLGEPRQLSAAARKDLLSPRLSYFEDDLTVLTWATALVVEPVREDTDVQFVLEFANAQLLELRWYDAVLDAEIPAIQSRFAQARRGFHLLGRRYSRLRQELQQRVADSLELIERVENALKVTDDVYLSRIYMQALEEFRERTWRSGIERKLAIVRSTYEMLNDESQARRSEVLEMIIIALIAFEIVLTFVRP